MEILTNSGRDRFNILGAYSPDDGSFLNIDGTDSCDAEMVQKLLVKMREANAESMPLIAILDNARYQHAKAVKRLAKKLKIELLYLPPYSPNLNLIERFWKFMKKKVQRTNTIRRLSSLWRLYGNSSKIRMSMRRNLNL